MNRKERRAAGGRAAAASSLDELLATAARHLEAGRNNNATKLYGQVLVLDERSVRGHDGLGMALQAQGRCDEAVRHFMQAIAVGLGDVEGLVKQRPAIGAPLKRFRDAWPRPLSLAEMFGADGLGAAAGEALLLALLQSRPVADVELEMFLTALRAALLRVVGEGGTIDDALSLVSALAQQCFINEYVFTFGPAEAETAEALRARIASGAETGAFGSAVAAMYAPLPRNARHAPEALVRQQIDEPREEAEDRERIAALTAIDDVVSVQVRQQYEENPYPRWTVAAPVRATTIEDYLQRCLPYATVGHLPPVTDILIAGCGTGGHSIETAQRFPQASVLAIDISRASLGYARRKTREAGLRNIEYAQADILKLGALGRSFDLIETVGVLHHLADPAAGLRVLVSLLRPGGLMLVGLYSRLARRDVTAARALIAERGYPPTPDGIRACRQEMINRRQVPATRDFFSVSGCRDLLFNVMEHQFGCAELGELIGANRMTFLSFEVPREVAEAFRRGAPGEASFLDLERWAAFEAGHPQTFAGMYQFWLQKPMP